MQFSLKCKSKFTWYFWVQLKNKSIILLVLVSEKKSKAKQTKKNQQQKTQLIPKNAAEMFCHSFSKKAEKNEKRKTLDN